MCAITIINWRQSSITKMFKSSFLLMLLAMCSSVHGNVTSTCGKKVMFDSYMDLAMDMIVRAKHYIPTCDDCPKVPAKKPLDCAKKPLDCADVLEMGHNKSGVYEIWPMNRVTDGKHLNVFCDMETDGGGWTVIQRRGDFQTPQDYFYQDWKSYKEGFGDIEKDFWLGNDNIFVLTNQKLYSVRFDLKDFQENKAYAHYGNFWIDDEDRKYTIHISEYSGDAGNPMPYHNKHAFSTKDRKNNNHTKTHCAEEHKGGWWYNECCQANLNGLYHKGKYITEEGIAWFTWKAWESLAWTEMKIRPQYFRFSFSGEVTPLSTIIEL